MAKGRKERTTGKPTGSETLMPYAVAAEADIVAPWLPGVLKIGVPLLFVAACAFGVLEVHSSTDTWIALMAGKAVLTQPQFPLTDTWSYTFFGEPWINQNWLSHVYFWLLYDKLGENAVVYGTWALGFGIFFFSLLATWFRSRSWLAATLAGGLVAIASRDWLSARPATVQFFLLSLLWLTLSSLISQGPRRRWWAIALLFPLFVAWPHAHGSFLFGYILVAMFLGWDLAVRVARTRLWWVFAIAGFVLTIVSAGIAIAVLGVNVDADKSAGIIRKAGLVGLAAAAAVGFARFTKPKSILSTPQMIALYGVVAVTVVLGAVLSPYGLENYTHPLVVTESAVFRTVGEWIPPTQSANYPPVLRFWIALGFACAAPLAALALLLVDRIRGGIPAPAPANATADTAILEARVGRHTLLFDIASVGLGLIMALFARRFAPIFYILAAPAVTAWILQIGRSLSPWMRCHARDAVILASWFLLAWTVRVTYTRADQELVKDIRPGDWNLLSRVTRLDQTPQDAVEFLARNKLTPNTFTEWTQAAVTLFGAPGTRVFIDGRSQQVYSEQQYQKYAGICSVIPEYANWMYNVFDECHTEAVLLRRTRSLFNVVQILEKNPNWVRIFESRDAFILARRGTPFYDEVVRRELAGDLWWPNTPEVNARRAWLDLHIRPEDAQHAIDMWKTAIEHDPKVGYEYYPQLTAALINQGRVDEALTYLAHEKQRIEGGAGNLTPEVRAQLLQAIARCEAMAQSYKQQSP